MRYFCGSPKEKKKEASLPPAGAAEALARENRTLPTLRIPLPAGWAGQRATLSFLSYVLARLMHRTEYPQRRHLDSRGEGDVSLGVTFTSGGS